MAVIQAVAAALAGVKLTVFASSVDCELIDWYIASVHQIIYSGDSPLAILQALITHHSKCLFYLVFSSSVLTREADLTLDGIRLQIYQATDLRLLCDARQNAKVSLK